MDTHKNLPVVREPLIDEFSMFMVYVVMTLLFIMSFGVWNFELIDQFGFRYVEDDVEYVVLNFTESVTFDYSKFTTITFLFISVVVNFICDYFVHGRFWLDKHFVTLILVPPLEEYIKHHYLLVFVLFESFMRGVLFGWDHNLSLIITTIFHFSTMVLPFHFRILYHTCWNVYWAFHDERYLASIWFIMKRWMLTQILNVKDVIVEYFVGLFVFIIKAICSSIYENLIKSDLGFQIICGITGYTLVRRYFATYMLNLLTSGQKLKWFFNLIGVYILIFVFNFTLAVLRMFFIQFVETFTFSNWYSRTEHTGRTKKKKPSKNFSIAVNEFDPYYNRKLLDKMRATTDDRKKVQISLKLKGNTILTSETGTEYILEYPVFSEKNLRIYVDEWDRYPPKKIVDGNFTILPLFLGDSDFDTTMPRWMGSIPLEQIDEAFVHEAPRVVARDDSFMFVMLLSVVMMLILDFHSSVIFSVIVFGIYVSRNLLIEKTTPEYMFLNVLWEECFKMYFPYFEYFELILKVRTYGYDLELLQPFMMHVVLYYFPVHIRVVLHFMWNLYCTRRLRGSAVDTLKDFVGSRTYARTIDVSQMLHLANLISNRDFKNFGICLVNYNYLEKLLKFMGDGWDLDTIISLLSFSVGDYEYTAGPEDGKDDKFRDILKMFQNLLPEDIAASPTTVAIIKFISLLVGTTILQSFAEFKDFIPLVSFQDLKPMDYANTVIETMKCIYKSSQSFLESGNLRDFFIDNRIYFLKKKVTASYALGDEEFLKEVDELIVKLNMEKDNFFLNFSEKLIKRKTEILKLRVENELYYKINTLLTKQCTDPDESWNTIAQIEDLIFAITVKGGGKFDHYIKRLQEKSKHLASIAIANTPRNAPFGIFLLGTFGIGKTLLISNLISLFYKVINEPLNKNRIATFKSVLKHPAEGWEPDTEVVVLNDELSDHSQDPKMNKMSFMEVFRNLFDTDNVQFPQAEAENKKNKYNKVKLVIMSTNEYSFVFSENCEKLIRRFKEHVVVLDVFGSKDGTRKDAGKLDLNDPDVRRKYLGGEVFRAEYAPEKHIKFVNAGGKFLAMGKMLRYVRERILAHETISESKKLMESHVCGCGVQFNNHFSNGEFEFITPECEYHESEASKPLSYCSCGLIRGHVPHDFGMCHVWEHTSNEIIFPERNFYDMVISFVGWIGLIVVLLKLPEVATNVMRALSFALRELREEITESLNDIADPVIRAALQVANDEVDMRVYNLRRKILKFLREYRFILGGFFVAGLLKVSYDYLNKKDEAVHSSVILTKENTDPMSCEIGLVKNEVAFKDPLARNWNKVGMTTNKVEIFTERVGKEDLMKMCRSKVFRFELIRAQPDEKDATGYVFSLSPDFLLVNTHYFYKNDKFVPATMKVFVDELKPISFLISEHSLLPIKHEDKRTDVCLLRNPIVIPQSDLTKFFLDDYEGETQMPMGITNVSDVINGVCSVSSTREIDMAVFPNYWVRENPMAAGGDCGNVCIGHMKKSAVILGIVSFRTIPSMFSSRLKCGGVILTRKMIGKAILDYELPRVEKIVLSEKVLSLGDMHVQSDFRNVHSQYFLNIGSEVGSHKNAMSTSLRPTPFHDDIAPLSSRPYGVPGKDSGVAPDGKWKSAFTQTFKNFNDDCLIDPGILDTCVNKYLDYVVTEIEKKQKVRLSPINLYESFFGDPEQCIDRCNFNSSIGPDERHFKDRKGMWNKEGELYRLNEKFRYELIRRINLLAAGIIIMPWYNGALKDEARPLEKLLDYKIRIFYTVDIYTNTIAKMFLMPLVMLLMKYPYISKCFGALNSGSKEWDDLFNYLRGKLTDMDFSCFDTSHWTILFKACAKFFYKLAQAFYRDEHYSKIVYYVVYSLCVALFSYNGTFSIKLKGLPSGHMLTLIINSIVNVLLMMVAFFLLCPDRFEDFFDLVTPADRKSVV